MRMGNMYGPDATFLGVPPADLNDPASYEGAAAVIVGAPFDGGTSHRPGCRFGPQAIRVVLEALSGIAWRRRQLAGEPVRQPTDPLLEHRRPAG